MNFVQPVIADPPAVTSADVAKTPNSVRIPAKLWIALFTVVLFVGEACLASHKPMWFDELATDYLAQRPSMNGIWAALRSGVDFHPPLSAVLTRLSYAAFGVNHVSVRLPSMLGFWLMCVALFAFVRRRSDTLHAGIALLFPFFTYASDYIIEGRPYGLVLGATASALYCWQSATEKESRQRLALLAGLTVSCAALVSSHYFAIYSIAAIAVGEAVRNIKRRAVDLPIWLALAVGTAPILVWWPLSSAPRAAMSHFWALPSLPGLQDSYTGLISPLWIAVLAFVSLAVARRRDFTFQRSKLPALRVHEAVACGVLMAMPMVAFCAAILGTNAFVPRYVLPSVVGTAVSVPMCLWSVGLSWSSRIAMKVLASAFCLTQLFNFLSVFGAVDPAAQVRSSYRFPMDPPLPIVLADYHDFWSLEHYGSRDLLDRCFFLVDTNAAIDILGTDIGDRTFLALGPSGVSHVIPYKTFLREHPDFYAAHFTSQGWLLPKLVKDGADVRAISINRPRGPSSDEQLYFRVHFVPTPPGN